MRTIHFRRAAAAMLAAMMLTPALPTTVSAEGTAPKKVVVIGDGVSSGRKLEDPAQSYVSLAAEYLAIDVTDLSADSCTTADLLVKLDDPAVQAELSQADIILFTAGVEDIMAPVIDQLTVFREELGFETLDDIYKAARSDVALTDDQLTGYSLQIKARLLENEESCAENIREIGKKLSAYGNAQIICPNVYNWLNTIDGFDELSVKRQMAYRSMLNPSEWVMETVNNAYASLETDYGFTVIDAHAQFSGMAYWYTNQLKADYEPAPTGHRWLAQQVIRIVDGTVTGDMDMDGAVNASDANLILEHASTFGSDQIGTFTERERFFADVNQDGKADAVDAAGVLVYAASVGAGDQNARLA